MKNISYYIYGNKVYYPSDQSQSVNNALQLTDMDSANEQKPPLSDGGFGTDITNLLMNNAETHSPYRYLRFYYPKTNFRK